MATALRTRDEIDEAYKWNLDSYYADDNQWEADFRIVEGQLPALEVYAGRVADSGETVLAALILRDSVNAMLDSLIAYAYFRRDEDVTHSSNQAHLDRAMTLEARFHTATAFFRPELLAVDNATLDSWFETTPALETYRYHLHNVRRLRPYIRSAEVEAVIALAGEMAQSPDTIFRAINNADLRFGTLHDQNGEEIELSHGRVWALLEQTDRHVRRTAWQQYNANLVDQLEALVNNVAPA